MSTTVNDCETLKFNILWHCPPASAVKVATAHDEHTAILIAYELSLRNLEGFYEVCDLNGKPRYVT